MIKENKSLVESAGKAGMCEKTARKYLESGKGPSEMKKEHTWRTREDPFESDWPEIKGMLETEPKLEALTIFQYLQRQERFFIEKKLLTEQFARNLLSWKHSGFSIDNSVRILDERSRENLAQYMARPPQVFHEVKIPAIPHIRHFYIPEEDPLRRF